MDELIDKTERLIKSLEHDDSSGKLDAKKLLLYKNKTQKIVQKSAKYTLNPYDLSNHISGIQFPFQPELQESEYNNWAMGRQLLDSRLLELRAVLAYAEQRPLDAKEYILICRQKLPMGYQEVSSIGQNLWIENSEGKTKSIRDKDWGTIVFVVICYGIIALLVIGFIGALLNPSSDNSQEMTDYCDTHICK